MNLGWTEISDNKDVLKKLVRGSPRLEWIGIGYCSAITSRSLEHIADNLNNVKGIDLKTGWEYFADGSRRYRRPFPVGSKGVEQLLGLPRLTHIGLLECQSDLRHFIETQRPDIEILYEWQFSRGCTELRNFDFAWI